MIFPRATSQLGLVLIPAAAEYMSATTATEIAQVTEAYIPIANLEFIIVDTFYVVSMMLVGTTTSAKKS
jgi:hypothetical protein